MVASSPNLGLKWELPSQYWASGNFSNGLLTKAQSKPIMEGNHFPPFRSAPLFHTKAPSHFTLNPQFFSATAFPLIFRSSYWTFIDFLNGNLRVSQEILSVLRRRRRFNSPALPLGGGTGSPARRFWAICCSSPSRFLRLCVCVLSLCVLLHIIILCLDL